MATSNSSNLKPQSPPPPPLRRSRRRYAAWICCVIVSVVFLLAVIALILAFTVFKARDPTTTLVSATVEGVSPRITFPIIRIELNITLDLDLLVYNPNRASFSHGTGTAEIFYRETKVGDVLVAPGRIPSHGSDHVYCRLTLEADRFSSHLGSLVQEVLAGRVGLDSSARIPGRVKLLGFVKRHAVAISKCHLVIGFPELKVVEDKCQQKTKL